MSEQPPPRPTSDGPPPPKRLYRSRRDRMIGGVCGGIAEYANIDPTIVRILAVATIFLAGSSIIAYLVAWAIVPEEPETV